MNAAAPPPDPVGRDGLGDAQATRGGVVPLDAAAVGALTRATAAGGVVCFPAEGVYGLAADPHRPDAVGRMVGLKGRDPAKPSALLFWSVEAALGVVEDAGAPVVDAVSRLVPGAIGVLVPHAAGRFSAVSAQDGTLGVRVAELPGGPVDAPPVLQTSANLAGGPDALELGDVPAPIRDGCDLVLDGGRRTGRPSTLVDLRGMVGARPTWRIVRHGAVDEAIVAAALDGLGRRAD